MNKNPIICFFAVYAVVFAAIYLDERKFGFDSGDGIALLYENGAVVCHLELGCKPEIYGSNENRLEQLDAFQDKVPFEKKERKFPPVSREAFLTEPLKMKKQFPVYLKKRWRR